MPRIPITDELQKRVIVAEILRTKSSLRITPGMWEHLDLMSACRRHRVLRIKDGDWLVYKRTDSPPHYVADRFRWWNVGHLAAAARYVTKVVLVYR